MKFKLLVLQIEFTSFKYYITFAIAVFLLDYLQQQCKQSAFYFLNATGTTFNKHVI